MERKKLFLLLCVSVLVLVAAYFAMVGLGQETYSHTRVITIGAGEDNNIPAGAEIAVSFADTGVDLNRLASMLCTFELYYREDGIPVEQYGDFFSFELVEDINAGGFDSYRVFVDCVPST